MIENFKINKTIAKENFKTIFRVNKIDYFMYFCVFSFTILPAIWNLLRTHIISNYISFNIETYAQWSYFESVLEILQEGMIFPLFWWFGTSFKNQNLNKNEIMAKIKTAFILITIIYCFALTLISPFSNKFIIFLDNKDYTENLSFFIFQLWSKLPEVLLIVCTTILILFQKYFYTLLLTIIKVSIGIFCDYFFASNLFIEPSLSLVGISTLIANSMVFIIAFILVIKIFGIKNFFISRNYIKPKNILSTSIWSFLDSFIRNFFYLVVIARLMNTIDGSQAYYVTNTIIWNWMLIPLITLADVHKSQTSKILNNRKASIILFFQYQLIALFAFLLMISIFLPLWKPIAFFMGNSETTTLLSWKLARILIGFYILYATSSTADSFFYGSGKTFYLTIQSLIVNFIIYFPVLLCWKIGHWQPNITEIALIFGIGIALDSLMAYILIFFSFLKWKEKKEDKEYWSFKPLNKQNLKDF